MTVLTISREIGSGGEYIGKKTAEILNYHYADKGTIFRIFKQYGFEPLERIYDSPTSFWDSFDNLRLRTLENLNRVIEALAAHGHAVIVGRGGFAVLDGLADVLNVRIQAPIEDRLGRFMEAEKLTNLNEALDKLEERDGVRSAFVESTYQIPWDAASNFDIVINTGKTTLDVAASWLAEIVMALDKRGELSGPTAQSLSVEPSLKKAVCELFDCRTSGD
ncbi:MAG: cytidylate kinase-like family protein [Pseudomonadota bacterium]